jgi:hypothetical protein
MKRKISDELKGMVAKRAGYRCEYCRLPERDSLLKFHVEHIRSSKHSGSGDFENLAYSCPDCNHYKGTDLGTYLDEDEIFTRFFNPRKDKWFDHFKALEGVLYAQNDVGEATIRIFQINNPDRVEIRQLFSDEDLYP